MTKEDLYVKYHDVLKAIADQNHLKAAPDDPLDNSVALDMLCYAMRERDRPDYEVVKGIPADFSFEDLKADVEALD